jgi:hypothetical protein
MFTKRLVNRYQGIYGLPEGPDNRPAVNSIAFYSRGLNSLAISSAKRFSEPRFRQSDNTTARLL